MQLMAGFIVSGLRCTDLSSGDAIECLISERQAQRHADQDARIQWQLRETCATWLHFMWRGRFDPLLTHILITCQPTDFMAQRLVLLRRAAVKESLMKDAQMRKGRSLANQFQWLPLNCTQIEKDVGDPSW
jgi:hypothetical protein